ncbi:SpoIIE family protein phosphatase [Candidatus Fermentibacteria bacterium]|nr:SpoIIE family protein phosphatase [Candidatus Fermentibacteria bacterium]
MHSDKQILLNAATELLLLQRRPAITRTILQYARRISGVEDITLAAVGRTASRRDRRGDRSVFTRIPLAYGRRTWGCLELGVAPKDLQGCRDDLEVLARWAARALRNAHVYSRLRQRVKGVTALYRVGTTITSTLNLRYLLDLILSSLREVISYDAAGIYLLEEDGVRLRGVAMRGYRPEEEKAAMAKLGQGVIGWAATQGTDLLVGDVSRNTHYLCARDQTVTEMVALLRRGTRLLGAFNVESDRPHAYGGTDLVLLRAFASQAAVAVDNAVLYRDAVEKRRLDSELSVASEIQQRLLPLGAPSLAGWEMAGLSVPATRIGGDYYDFVGVSPGVIGIAIADVAGKGVPAALVMATFRACLLAEIVNEYSIEMIFRKVNEILLRSTEPSVFVTAIYGALEAGSGVFTYCNAGHIEPLVVPQHGAPRILNGSDLILGAFGHASYHQRRIELRPGEVLVLATDGIIEASAGDEEFGLERVCRVVQAHQHASAVEIRDHIHAEVLRFAVDQQQRDDMTAVVVKRLPG